MTHVVIAADSEHRIECTKVWSHEPLEPFSPSSGFAHVIQRERR